MSKLKDKQFIRSEIANTEEGLQEQCRDLETKTNDMAQQTEHMLADL